MMAASPRLVIVHNILTPYRVHLFTALARELRDRGIALEVWHMAHTEPGRYWSFDPAALAFPSHVGGGWHPRVRGMPFHFNPSIVGHVLKRPPRWLWLGGAWYLPTTLLLSGLAPLHRGMRTFLWYEATLASAALRNGIGSRIKRTILDRYSALIVPGASAREAAETCAPGVATLELRNVVDEHLYRDRVKSLRHDEKALRVRYGLGQDEVVLVWPARLHPVKGILNFLGAVAEDLTSRPYTILLAGEGPQRAEVEAWIAKTGFQRLRLLGNCDEPTMLELYALADALLLPSLSEPYGLAVVEGLWAGLPALVSDRVGAWPETVEAGSNGWVVDPTQPGEVRAALEQAVSLGREGLRHMGQASLALAQERFQTGPAIQRFVEQLVGSS